MFSIKGLFSNKHRAYLLSFALIYLFFRLPILITNKIERVIASNILNISNASGTIISYDGLKVDFPASANFSSMTFTPIGREPVVISNIHLKPQFSYPINIEMKANLFKGSGSCKFNRGLFSSDLGVDCLTKDLELNEIPQIKELNIIGPLSFNVKGSINPDKKASNLEGKFLSQLDTSKVIMPKNVPTFIKLPNFGIMDLKGDFKVQDKEIMLNDTSLVSSMGEVGISMKTTFNPAYNEILDLDSKLDIKLLPSGTQAIGPWIGLALGGIEFPSSGQGIITIKGNSRGGFKPTLSQ